MKRTAILTATLLLSFTAVAAAQPKADEPAKPRTKVINITDGESTDGDPTPWAEQNTDAFSLLSFLNAQKYPPSLQYLLMTLGPAILFLAWAEKLKGWFASALIVIGRVPFFYYVLHIYLIHVLAVIAAQLTGFGWQSMMTDEPVWREEALKGYGFSLPVVYLVWVGVVLALYLPCVWFNKLKSNNRQWWWLSYL